MDIEWIDKARMLDGRSYRHVEIYMVHGNLLSMPRDVGMAATNYFAGVRADNVQNFSRLFLKQSACFNSVHGDQICYEDPTGNRYYSYSSEDE